LAKHCNRTNYQETPYRRPQPALPTLSSFPESGEAIRQFPRSLSYFDTAKVLPTTAYVFADEPGTK
jgi:hypothetical protein